MLHIARVVPRSIRLVLQGSITVAALFAAGCGGRLVDPGRSQPLEPAGIQPQSLQTTPARSELDALPRVPASTVLPQTSQPSEARYYEVRRGDSLTQIARLYGTTVDRLLESNGLRREAILQPGQLLFIPQ